MFDVKDAPHVVLDVAQTRVATERFVIFARGLDGEDRLGRPKPGWDLVNSTNVTYDPVTYTAMLAAYQATDTWLTTGAGNYARPQTANYVFGNAAKWTQVADNITGTDNTDYWQSLNSPDAPQYGRLAAGPFPKNRAIYLGFFCHTDGKGDFICLEAGWGPDQNYLSASSVWFRFSVRGRVEIWKNGVQVGEEHVNGPQIVGHTSENKHLRLMLIPWRYREIGVISLKANSGFSFRYEDIDPQDEDAIITPAGHFWFNVPQGSAKIQIKEATYPTSGVVNNTVGYFAKPPPAILGTNYSFQTYDSSPNAALGVYTSTPTLLDGNTYAAFVPDGIKTKAVLSYTLAGDGNGTPFLYAGVGGYRPTFVNTDDSEQADITPFITELELVLSEDPTADAVHIVLKEPQRIIDTICPTLLDHGGKPVSIYFGKDKQRIVFDGITDPPEIKRGLNDKSSTVSLTIRNGFARLERANYRDQVILDRNSLLYLQQFWFIELGWGVADIHGVVSDPDAFDMEDPSYEVGAAFAPTAGDFGTYAAVGDNGKDWVKRLYENYSGDWYYGLKPNGDHNRVCVWSRSPTGLGTDSDVTLYKTVNSAITYLKGLGYSDDDAATLRMMATYSEFSYREIAAEANEVRVTGRDPMTDLPIQYWQEDANSKDATLKPSLRPRNWFGDSLLTGTVDEAITTPDDCSQGVTAMFGRVTQPRKIAQSKSGLLWNFTKDIIIWRGDKVSVEGEGTFRITSMHLRVLKVPQDGTNSLDEEKVAWDGVDMKGKYEQVYDTAFVGEKIKDWEG